MDSDVEPSAVFVGSSQIDSKQPVGKPRSLSEQKDIDDFEKEERRIISEESSQVGFFFLNYLKNYTYKFKTGNNFFFYLIDFFWFGFCHSWTLDWRQKRRR